MSPHIPKSFISAWFERSVELQFDRSKQRMEALQEAAGRIRHEAACSIVRRDDKYICLLVSRDPGTYKSVPFFGFTIAKPLPPMDPEIANRFLSHLAEVNSQRSFNTAPSSRDDISALGIAETLLAISASVALAVYLNDFKHIVVGTIIAPFLLLRSNDINGRILQTAETYLKWIRDFTLKRWEALQHYREVAEHEPGTWRRLCNHAILFPRFLAVFLFDIIFNTIGILLGFQFIKLFYASQFAIRHPLRALSEIPSNWRRIALSTNCRQTPEVLPNIEDADPEKYDLGWWKNFKSQRGDV
jgi:hypothetical protein